MAQVTVTSLDNYQTLVTTDDHALLADEPKGVGDGLGPDPYQLLLSSLGVCTAMTLEMYARRKGWALRKVHLELAHGRVHARDCEECEGDDGLVDRIHMRMKFEGDLNAEQRERLAYIATRCPVRKTVSSGPVITEEMVG